LLNLSAKASGWNANAEQFSHSLPDINLSQAAVLEIALDVLQKLYGQNSKVGVMSGLATIVPESELYSRIRCLIL
jgi:hypothetical protein